MQGLLTHCASSMIASTASCQSPNHNTTPSPFRKASSVQPWIVTQCHGHDSVNCLGNMGCALTQFATVWGMWWRVRTSSASRRLSDKPRSASPSRARRHSSSVCADLFPPHDRRKDCDPAAIVHGLPKVLAAGGVLGGEGTQPRPQRFGAELRPLSLLRPRRPDDG